MSRIDLSLDTQQQSSLWKQVMDLLKKQKVTAALILLVILLNMTSIVLPYVGISSAIKNPLSTLIMYPAIIFTFMVYVRLLRPLPSGGIIGRIIMVMLILAFASAVPLGIPILLPSVNTVHYIKHIEPFIMQLISALTFPFLPLLISGWYQRRDLKIRFLQKDG